MLTAPAGLEAECGFVPLGVVLRYGRWHYVEVEETAVDTAVYTHVNTNYWFYGRQPGAGVGGAWYPTAKSSINLPLRRVRCLCHMCWRGGRADGCY